MAALFGRMSMSHSFKLTTSDGADSNPTVSFPNSITGPSAFTYPNQIRQNPYPPISNSANSRPGNRRRQRVRNQPLSRSPNYAAVEAILRSCFPIAPLSDISLAAGACTQLFEGNNSLQRVSSPARSFFASSNGGTVYGGFLRRNS